MSRIDELRKRGLYYGLLSDWYGSDRAEVEIGAHTGKPVVLGDAVDSFLREVNAREVGDFIRIDSHWNEWMPMISRMARPASLKHGVLYLEVRHSALIPELSPSLDLIKKKLDESCGGSCCREIRLTVSGGVDRRRYGNAAER